MEAFRMLMEKELCYAVRGCVYEVFGQLGCGFLEKIYENALMEEFRLRNLRAEAQVPVQVKYKDTVVGDYVLDVLIEKRIILELKAQQQVSKVNEAQLLNYLKATGLRIGMLINFTYPKATIRRFVI
jgi:GxxExxY protein